MSQKRVVSVFYSASGNTRKVVNMVGSTVSELLKCPHESIDISTPNSRENMLTFSSGDIIILGSPTYRGKLPLPIAADLKRILKGDGTYAIAVTTFGNRAFENILAEMKELLKGNGFIPVSAGAFVGTHVYSDKLAGGRPDDDDLAFAKSFAQRSAEIIMSGSVGDLEVPGDASAKCYQPKGADGNAVNFHDAKPVTDMSKCDSCGLCVKLCPLGSIDKDCTTVSGECIKCHACIKRCPKGAKSFTDKIFLSHVEDLEKNHCSRKENAVFYSCE